MAVFTNTKITVNAAEDLLREADKTARKVDRIITLANKLADGVPAFLKTLKKAVKSLKTLNKRSINVLRNNPLARGVWKVLMNIVAGILAGIMVVLNALEKAVEAAIRLLTRRSLKKLKKVIDEIEEKMIDYFIISNKLQVITAMLYNIAAFLEKQQIPLEKKYPALIPTVEGGELKRIKKEITKLTDLLVDLNKEIDEVLDAINQLHTFLNRVNVIVALAASVSDIISSVLGMFDKLFQKIKELISKIPFIGYLQHKLSQFIDWAMDKLGIKRAMAAIGKSVKKLPFIKAIFDFLDGLKKQVEDLIAKIKSILNDVLENIKIDETLKAISETIIGIFAKLNLDKFVQEFFISEWLDELIKHAQDINGLLEKPTSDKEEKPEEKNTLTSEMTRFEHNLYDMANLMHLVPELPHTSERQHEIHTMLADTLLAFNEISLEQPVDKISKQLSTVSTNMTKMKDSYTDTFNPDEFDSEYKEEGLTLIKQRHDEDVAVFTELKAMEFIENRSNKKS